MVRTLISYTLAAGIITPPALLSPHTSPKPEVKSAVPQYPLLRTTQSIPPRPIPHNHPTIVSPPVTPQPVAPQFVLHRPEPVTIPPTLEMPPPPSPPPEPTVVPVPAMPIEKTPEGIPIAVLPPPPPIETPEVETPDTSTPPTDLTVLRDVVSQAHITSTAPMTAYDIMSGESLWETTEALNIQANNHQVILDDQVHSELVLTVPDNEFITVNGTDYPGGLIIRAQDNELYVINYLSVDQITAVQLNIIVPVEQPLTQAHSWYDLDGRLPEHPPQIAHHGSP